MAERHLSQRDPAGRRPGRSPGARTVPTAVADVARPATLVGGTAAMLTLTRRALPAEAPDLGAGLHPVLRRVYAARGLRCAEDLNHSLERLAPVGSLGGASEAAQLLVHHRAGRVLVVGDFDADGATSTA